MALLTHRSRALALFTGILGVLAGCALVERLVPSDEVDSFPHRLHVEAAGLTCAQCHAAPDGGPEPVLPGPEVCARCHAASDAGLPPERRVSARFDGEHYRATRAGALGDEPLFAHAPHLTSGLDCAACHAEVARDEGHLGARASELAPSMDACLACHAERGGPREAECAACHRVIRAEEPPPSHASNWLTHHGAAARARTGERSATCSLCHARNSCDDCHRSAPPASHDPFWRRRGHGLEAALARDSCATCHEPDSCARCHEATRPRSHTASFGAPRDRHCLTCHEPLRSSSCGVCHQDTPSHELATPMPEWHTPAMNCRQCHGNGQPLPHVDNGSRCTACHP